MRYSFDIYNGAVRRLQADDYYAFGKRRSVSPVGLDNKYLYNGKEVQDELGEKYDYGARFYDPIIGRWNVVDPLANKYDYITPYSYVANNPLKYTDPDGRLIVDKNGKIVFTPLGTTVVHHGSGSSAKVVVGYIYADDGTKIMAFKNLSGKKSWDTDCHGQTFTNSKYWINNDQVRRLLKGDNYEKVDESNAKKGDKVIYTDENGEVQDSRIVNRTNTPDGTCLYGQGGLEEDNYESQIDQTWVVPGTKKEVYRKTDSNKSLTTEEAQKLIIRVLENTEKKIKNLKN